MRKKSIVAFLEWHVAVAAGKAGEEKTCKKVVEIAMPREGAALRDWQAVVIGGGVINGLGLHRRLASGAYRADAGW